MTAVFNSSGVGCTVTIVPALAGWSHSTQVVSLFSSHSALPTVVRAPPDGNAPPPWPPPGGAGANGSLGQAVIVYVTGRMFPDGSAISGVISMAGLLAGSGNGILGLIGA